MRISDSFPFLFERLPENVIHNVSARLNDEDLTSLTLTSKSIAACPALIDEWSERSQLTGFASNYTPNRAYLLPRQFQKRTQFAQHYEELKLRAATLDVQADSQTIKQHIANRFPAYHPSLVHADLVFTTSTLGTVLFGLFTIGTCSSIWGSVGVLSLASGYLMASIYFASADRFERISVAHELTRDLRALHDDVLEFESDCALHNLYPTGS